MNRIVLVGAGSASASAAATLRNEGFTGEIVLVGDEAHLPYERPPLSKGYVRGGSSFDDALLHPMHWYADHQVDVRLGVRAERVTAAQADVELSDGSLLSADAVLLATGGRARRLPGPPRERVLYLRTVGDADRIADQIAPGRHLVMIGAGFIGAELAASATAGGADVTILEKREVPLAGLLGERMGRVCAGLHREAGVDLRTGVEVREIEEGADGVVVSTDEGLAIEADAVVVGVGLVPNIEVAQSSGIVTDDGVVVDAFCRASVDNVFAAGDVANHYHPLYGRYLRVEHHDNALRGGAVAALSMLGRPEPYDDAHWFWSDQYGHSLQYAGFVEASDDMVVRGSAEARDLTALYLADGVLRAAFGLNRNSEVRAAKRLISRRAVLNPDLLADDATNLRELARQHR